MKHLYVGKFSHREGFQRVFFIYFLFFSIIITAQTYPETVQLNNVQYESYQTPTGPKPGYLQETTNEFYIGLESLVQPLGLIPSLTSCMASLEIDL